MLGFKDPDYSGWHPTIHRIRELRWELTAARWELKAKRWEQKRIQQGLGKKPLLPIGEVLAALNRSVVWFSRMRLAVRKLSAFPEEEFRLFWNEKFLGIFNPPLEEYSRLAGSELVDQCDRLLHTWARVEAESLELRELYNSVKGISYSAFTNEEIEYLRTKAVIEFGCGSGLLLSRLPETALGIDNAEKLILKLSNQADNFEWTRELLGSGRLILGGPELLSNQHYAKRTLVISWPTYGRRGPVKALKVFTEAGGQFFMLKFGVYVDWWTIDNLGTPKFASSGKNFRDFMTVLAEYWREAPTEGQPEYNALALGDNSWYFVRRTGR